MKKKNIILLIIVILLLLGFTICFLSEYSNKKIFLPTDENAQDWNGDQSLPNGGKQETNTIKIPGFDALTFKANQTSQQVNFKNPEENSCLFRMTLLIDDKQYWQSAGGIEPGKGYYEIELDEGLQSGNYEGTLLVECFKKDGTALNNAKVKFDLEVTEE